MTVAPLSDAQGPPLTDEEFSQMWKGLDEDGAIGLEAAVKSIIVRRVRAASRTALIEAADEIDQYSMTVGDAIHRLRDRAATYDAGDDE